MHLQLIQLYRKYIIQRLVVWIFICCLPFWLRRQCSATCSTTRSGVFSALKYFNGKTRIFLIKRREPLKKTIKYDKMKRVSNN